MQRERHYLLHMEHSLCDDHSAQGQWLRRNDCGKQQPTRNFKTKV
jgi:hypothetical protein